MKNKYNDFWLIITGSILSSYLVDALNREDSFFQRVTNGYFYYDLAGGFVIALLLWLAVRFATVYLDGRYHWLRDTGKRLVLQFMLGVLLPSLLSFFFTLAFMKWSYNQDIFQTSWMYSEYYLVILIIVLINLIYFTWWLFQEQKDNPQPEAVSNPDGNTETGLGFLNHSAEKKVVENIEVAKAGKKIILPLQQIAYAYLSNGYCYIKAVSSESYLTAYTLEEISDWLPQNDFVRINRQMIISKKACAAYQSIENGKIELELTPPFKDAVIVSQKRAKEFRKWVSPLPKD